MPPVLASDQVPPGVLCQTGGVCVCDSSGV